MQSSFLKEGRGDVSITSERLLVGQALLLALLTTAHQAAVLQTGGQNKKIMLALLNATATNAA